MKAKLKYLTQTPYGNEFKINRPDLGMVGTGTTFVMLETNVKKYRIANGIPIGLGFSEDLEAQICLLYPKECDQTDEILPLNRRHNLDDIIRGTKVLLSFKRAGSPYVPKEEALRRAAICSKCPLCQSFPRGCGGGLCGELKEIVDAMVSGYSTPLDTDLRACAICRCFAGTHVKVPYKHLAKGLTEEMKEQFQRAHDEPGIGCWKVEGAV